MIFTVGGFLLVPVITQQVAQLEQNFNSYVDALAKFVDDGQKTLISWGVRDVDINKFYSDLAGQAQGIAMGMLNNTLSILQAVATLAFQLILALILSFYFMKDGDRLFGGILNMLPPRWQDEARLMALSIEKSFGAFIRGQLLFALTYAVLTAAVMLWRGLDYVIIASLVAGLCMIIPLVGNFLAYAPPMLVCLVTKPQDWLITMVALIIVQSFQMNFVGPRIMSQAIGIHPLYTVAAMLVGGQVAGIWGALFGIPVAGAINLVGRPFMRRIRHQVPLYQEVGPEHLTTRSFVTGPLRSSAEDEANRARAADAVPVMPPQPVDYNLDLEEEEEETPVFHPTLSGKVWQVIWVMVSRAYAWVGTRARTRSSRQ